MPNLNPNAFGMTHSHDPEFGGGRTDGQGKLQHFWMASPCLLSSASHQEMDIHPLLLFAGSWGGGGRVNREGRVGESQDQETRFYLRS